MRRLPSDHVTRASLARLALLALAACGCGGVDTEESAILSLDERARAAGIGLEVAGERVDGALPVAVPVDEDAYVIRAGGRERLALAPGERIEVRGPEGEVLRGSIDADRFVVTGTAEGAASLAELLGARLEPLSRSEWALSAPGVLWAAALIRDVDVPGVRAASSLGASSFERALAEGDGAWAVRGEAIFVDRATLDADEARGAIPDAAALVGVYGYGDVLFVLDAAGGYLLRTSEGAVHGTYRPCAGGVELRPESGAPFRMRLFGESLVDEEVGLALAPSRPGRWAPHDPMASVLGALEEAAE